MLSVRCVGDWYAVSKVCGGLVCCQYGVWRIGTQSVWCVGIGMLLVRCVGDWYAVIRGGHRILLGMYNVKWMGMLSVLWVGGE